MQSEALKRAQKKYLKNIRHFHLTFHINKDADIIAVLDRQENKNEYIRDLIRSNRRGGDAG